MQSPSVVLPDTFLASFIKAPVSGLQFLDLGEGSNIKQTNNIANVFWCWIVSQ